MKCAIGAAAQEGDQLGGSRVSPGFTATTASLILGVTRRRRLSRTAEWARISAFTSNGGDVLAAPADRILQAIDEVEFAPAPRT